MGLPEKETEKQVLLYRLYKLLLQKYADIVNEREKRTIGEVKALIDPSDLTIQSLVSSFKTEKYSFEKDFLPAAEKAFRFASQEIAFVKADVRLSFWLSPKEIVESRVADDEDHAVFFCSLLLALGNEKAEVVIAEMEDLSTHAFVITEYQSRFFLWDPSQQHPFNAFSGFKENVLARYEFNRSKIKRFLYKFNRTNYEQFL